MKAKNRHVGSSFEDFLEEEGRLEESTELALKRVLAWQFQRAMQALDVNQTEMARRMKTSRAVVNRLLNDNDPAVTLSTISRAANALGASLTMKLELHRVAAAPRTKAAKVVKTAGRPARRASLATSPRRIRASAR